MSKPGVGGIFSSQAAGVQRRERLRDLIKDISSSNDSGNDPYIVKNYLGHYECRLCATTHPNEGNYMAHTQGKKHQTALAKRQLQIEKEKQLSGENSIQLKKLISNQSNIRKQPKIGRPGYRVIKQRNSVTGELSILFHLYFPQIDKTLQPRHRFMSCYEQKIEPYTSENEKYIYLIISGEPYENISFKIPNQPIDRDPGKMLTHWDDENKSFTLQIAYQTEKQLQISLHSERQMQIEQKLLNQPNVT